MKLLSKAWVATPLQAALKSATVVVERLLERERSANGGKYPETIALVLWGTDNIKTYGESLAQVRARAPREREQLHVRPEAYVRKPAPLTPQMP